MRKMKKWLLSTMALAFSATMAFAGASCFKKGKDSSSDHTHSYSNTVTPPTCTEEGYTTHVCSCGESYVDTKVAALGHNYETKITKYPSATAAGERTSSCTRCDSVTTETIPMLTVSMPQVSEVLVAVIGSVNAKIAIDEGSTIVYATELESTTVTVSLAEAVLDTQDGTLAGHIKLDLAAEIEAADETKTNETMSAYFYVNGEAIGFEVVAPDGTENKQETLLSEAVYTAIANEIGMQYEEVVSLAYAGSELAKLAPAFFNLIANEVQLPTITEEYVTGLQTLFQSVGQDIIVETKDGTNNVYTVDLSVLGRFVDEVKDETLGSYIDKVYGAGSTKAFTDFVVGVPAMTVKEIANSAITLGNTYGIDVEHIYYLVNLVAAQAGAKDFDIQKEIESRYDMTLAALIIPADANMTVEQLQQMLTIRLTAVANMTLDDLYNAFAAQGDVVAPDGGVAEPTPQEEFSITDELSELIAQLPEMATASITFDAEGNFVACNVMVGPYSCEITAIDAVYTMVTVVEGVEVSITASESGIEYSVVDGETTIVDVYFKETATGYEGNVEFDGNDYLDLTLTTEGGALVGANVSISGYDVVDYVDHYDENGNYIGSEEIKEFKKFADIEYTAQAENGVITSAYITIDTWVTEEVEKEDEDGNAYSEWVDYYKEAANITYTNNADDIDVVLTVYGEARVELGNNKTANGDTWTLTVIDTSELVEETLAQFTAGYVTEDTKTTFTWGGEVYEDEIGDVLDGSLVVDNGEIVHYDFWMNNWGGSGQGTGDHYYVDGVEYVDYKTTEETNEISISYDKTAAGAKFNVVSTTHQTTKSGTERLDTTLGEWVTVHEEVYNDEYVDEYGFEYTANSVTLTLNGADLVVTVLDNGIEFNAADMVGFSITVDGNTLHIGYDIEMLPVANDAMFAGEGGISITIS